MKLALKKTPQIRFNEFKGNWVYTNLEELLSFKNGINASKEDYGTGYKFINVLDIIQNNFITNEKIIGSVNVSQDVFKKNIVKYGDILFQRSSETREEVGQSSVYLDKEKTATFGGFVIRGKKIGEFEPFFLHSLLKSSPARKEITTKSGGSTRYNVGQKTLSSVSLFFPSLREQQKIATFLTDLDVVLTQLTKKKELLEAYKKGIMQKIFNQEIRFKDDDGNDYPKWEEKSLGQLGRFQTSSVDKLNKKNEQEVYLVNYMNVYRHEKISNLSVKKFQIVTAKEGQIKSSDLKRGDILFTPSSETPADIGHSVVIFEDIHNAVYSYHLIRFRPTIELNILFSHYFCNTSLVLKQLSRFSTGSTRFTISIGNFSKVNVSFPCIEEQAKIANFLSDIDTRIEVITKKIEKAQSFKKGLLQQMFV